VVHTQGLAAIEGWRDFLGTIIAKSKSVQKDRIEERRTKMINQTLRGVVVGD